MKPLVMFVIAASLMVSAVVLFLLAATGKLPSFLRWIAIPDALAAIGFAAAGVHKLLQSK